MRRYVTRGDIVVIVLVSLLSVSGMAWVDSFAVTGRRAVVEVDGRKVLELPLDTDVTTSVTGPRGETVIAVEDGTVRIIESSCPAHYCIRMGRLSHPGEIAVCVPNRVVVTVTGGAGHGGYDGVTQ